MLKNKKSSLAIRHAASADIAASPESTPLLSDIRGLIESSRQRVAVGVNAELSFLYWSVGKRINEEILGEERAEYGKQIVYTLCNQLTAEFGQGWGERQLWYCVKFAQAFPSKAILHTLCSELSWSHIRLLLPVDDPLKRDFYIEMCKLERWSVRTLQGRIGSMLYERTALSKKPEQTIQNDLALLKNEGTLTPDLVFRDPYFLDYLGHYAGGITACSRRLSDEGATPPDYMRYNTAPWKGAGYEKCTTLASFQDAISLMHGVRWYHTPSLARPPATCSHAFGMKNRLAPPRELLEKKLLNAIQLARQRLAEISNGKKPFRGKSKTLRRLDIRQEANPRF